MIGRLFAIVTKELDDVRQSRLILTTLIVPTILYILLSVVALWVGSLPGQIGLGLDVVERSLPANATGSATYAFQAVLVDQVLVLYMLAPLFIPLTIASYSVIGEKQLRTLEPLLATPVRTWELLVAKSLAAVIPGVLVSWVSYGAFVLLAVIHGSLALAWFALGPVWLVSFGLVSPLFALLSVGMAVIASSRTSDPRAAQQLGAIVILPISALLTAQVFGMVRLDVWHALLMAAVAGACDLVMLWAAVRLFARETILTRWR